MTGYFRTIEDLERATYGLSGGSNIMKAALTGIHPIHDQSGGTPASGGDATLYNLVYGQKVWSMINREINALSMLPKKPWKSSGWRVMKGRSLGGNGDTFELADLDLLGGQTENAQISSIDEIKPTFANLSLSPKTVAHTFELSEIAQLLGGMDDGIGDIISTYREEVGITHAEAMNSMVLTDLSTGGLDAPAASGKDYDNPERSLTSLYKIISTHAEMNALSNLDGNAKLNLFGTARASTGTEYLDAYVDSNSGTARNLTVNMLNTALRNLMARGGSPKVFLTGYDTIQTLGELLQAQERFMGRTEVVPSHAGIKGVKGREVGFKVATYHDIPIIPCKDMPTGGSGISDILLLDTDHLFLCTLKPTEYFEGGMNTKEIFGHGFLGHRGLYRTIAETMCTYVRGQGKLIDLQ
tara:strand:- start:10819 stop:12054 length:1236 start_codon:yes stop_codon:yes gene_type:complete